MNLAHLVPGRLILKLYFFAYEMLSNCSQTSRPWSTSSPRPPLTVARASKDEAPQSSGQDGGASKDNPYLEGVFVFDELLQCGAAMGPLLPPPPSSVGYCVREKLQKSRVHAQSQRAVLELRALEELRGAYVRLSCQPYDWIQCHASYIRGGVSWQMDWTQSPSNFFSLDQPMAQLIKT